MIASLKSRTISFWEVLITAVLVIPPMYLSFEYFALVDYYLINGHPSLDSLERIEGTLIDLSYCTSGSKGHKSSIAKIQTVKGVVSLTTDCEVDKVAKKFFLKNEKIVAYKERLPRFILRSPNVVQLTVNDIEVLNYQSLIKYQNTHSVLIIILNLVLLFFWIAAFWWVRRNFKKRHSLS